MLWLTLVLSLFFSAAAAAQTARIATWNLNGFHAIPTDKLDRIIEGLRLLDADIIVLPELNPISHAETIASLADYAAQVTDHLPVLAEFDVSVDHD